MKKLALMLLLTVSMGGFAVGCNEPAKKPAPAATEKAGDKMEGDKAADKAAEPAAPKEDGKKE